MKDDYDFNLLTGLWVVGAILVVMVVLSAATRYFVTPSPPDPPRLEETAKVVVVRLYANLAPADSYALVSADSYVCYIDQVVWLQTVLGQPATCPWKKIEGK